MSAPPVTTAASKGCNRQYFLDDLFAINSVAEHAPEAAFAVNVRITHVVKIGQAFLLTNKLSNNLETTK
jgi:hypothetical protein